ncbi:hypothetical protein NDU88_001227 [Pleurodeles waltl]|uniref:Uncharacterized protein n=1 Tax=Pleurodeles waltl TaxID=8319 RepID=A0AAV7MJ48_PLEWA|nr:hypothetical protein NDU88_001227 [Pleurodeles waltl]
MLGQLSVHFAHCDRDVRSPSLFPVPLQLFSGGCNIYFSHVPGDLLCPRCLRSPAAWAPRLPLSRSRCHRGSRYNSLRGPDLGRSQAMSCLMRRRSPTW